MLKFIKVSVLLLFWFGLGWATFVMGQMPAEASRSQRPPTNYVAKFAGVVVGLFAVAYIWQLQRGARKK